MSSSSSSSSLPDMSDEKFGSEPVKSKSPKSSHWHSPHNSINVINSNSNRDNIISSSTIRRSTTKRTRSPKRSKSKSKRTDVSPKKISDEELKQLMEEITLDQKDLAKFMIEPYLKLESEIIERAKQVPHIELNEIPRDCASVMLPGLDNPNKFKKYMSTISEIRPKLKSSTSSYTNQDLKQENQWCRSNLNAWFSEIIFDPPTKLFTSVQSTEGSVFDAECEIKRIEILLSFPKFGKYLPYQISIQIDHLGKKTPRFKVLQLQNLQSIERKVKEGSDLQSLIRGFLVHPASTIQLRVQGKFVSLKEIGYKQNGMMIRESPPHNNNNRECPHLLFDVDDMDGGTSPQGFINNSGKRVWYFSFDGKKASIADRLRYSRGISMMAVNFMDGTQKICPAKFFYWHL